MKKFPFLRSDFKGSKSIRGARIVLVVTRMELGGAERQALLLARLLRREHHARVAIWACVGEPGRLSDLCREHGIPWRIAPVPWVESKRERLRGIIDFARQLRRARPDFVLPFTTIPNTFCGLAWRLSGARMCIWNQRNEGLDGLDSLSGRMGALAERLATRLTPCFVSNSRAGGDFLAREYNISRERIHIVFNGIEAPDDDAEVARKQRAHWRQALALDDAQFVACMVANLHMLKDHATLLRAWKIVLDRWPTISSATTISSAMAARPPMLLLAGRHDDLSDSLQALADELELGGSARFLGAVPDVPALLNAVDLGVLSSRSEGCPNAVLESMAAGLAVTGTDIAGLRDALGEASSRYLAPPGDALGLAQRILQLAENDDLCAQLGRANRRRIEHEFNPSRMGRAMADLMRKGSSSCSSA